MSTTGTCSAIRAPASRIWWTLAPASSASVAAAWMTGPSASGSRERHAELDHVGAVVGVGDRDPHRGLDVGEAAHQVRHQRGAPARAKAARSAAPPGERAPGRASPSERALWASFAAHASPSLSSASARSLSPRPDRQIRSTVSAVAVSRPAPSTQATAWADSSAGMIPSSSARRWKACSACVVGDALVGRAAGVAQPRVLGAGAGVVEAGADRVRLEDLAVLVLHDRAVGAVQDAAAAADGERRTVAAGLDPLPRRLGADQLHAGVVDERDEGADRVRAAADAGDHAVGQPAGLLEDLRARLVADDPLQVAHERGERRGADARADHVVGVADVGDPVADRRADGLLERARCPRPRAPRARRAAPCAARWAPGGACPRCPCRRCTRAPSARTRWRWRRRASPRRSRR